MSGCVINLLKGEGGGDQEKSVIHEDDFQQKSGTSEISCRQVRMRQQVTENIINSIFGH